MNNFFSDNIKQTLMITSFVMVMMLIIEFINVFTKGKFSSRFQKNPVLQILIATFLGAIPGCLGTYATVSLFTHNVISFGALASAMIATAGDETFLMLSMFPATAIKLIIVLIIIAITTGLLINLFEKRKRFTGIDKKGFTVHYESKNECLSIKKELIYHNLRYISFKRAILIITLLIFIIGLLLGEFENFHVETKINGIQIFHEQHTHNSWVAITFFILSVIALIISLLATNHFLEHHLWDHIIKVHLLRIFLWTLGTLVVINLLAQFININQWIESNKYIILFFAVLIGIIPVSGPHIVFLSLFFNGVIPLSILLANSIVQDGHGALPLLAESKKSFIRIKSLKIIIGLFLGFLLMINGF